MGQNAAEAEEFSMFILRLTMTKSIKVFNPTVVRIGFAVIHLCDQEQIDRIASQVFREVEGVDSSTFGIAKDDDGQVILMFDVWNFVEWGGKFYTSEVESSWWAMYFVTRASFQAGFRKESNAHFLQHCLSVFWTFTIAFLSFRDLGDRGTS